MKKLFILILLLVVTFYAYKYLKNNPSFFKKDIPENEIQKTEVIYSFNLYFNNSIKNPNLIDCTTMYPVPRKTKEIVTPEFVINELIKGLTDEEKKEGFVTAIPVDCVLNFVSLDKEKIIVDFKPFHIAGSCATGMFTAQVKNTMLALANIKEVQITIQGQSEEILQP